MEHAQPLTFGGVAQFAHASLWRVWAFQGVAALLAAGVLVWFLEIAWVPVINRTIAALPAKGAIDDGVLKWPQPGGLRMAGSTFLWISVDPTDSLEAGDGADLQIEFGRRELRCRSFFGYCMCPYPTGYVIALNRTELDPWWGAWHPALGAVLGLAICVALFLSWWILALVYAWPVRLVAFYADRTLSFTGAWRLASASLLPGAVFLTLCIAAYAGHHIQLLQLMFAAVLHLMIGWIYLLFSPFCLPVASSGRSRKTANPFEQENPKPGPPAPSHKTEE